MRKNIISFFILVVIFGCKENKTKDLVQSQEDTITKKDSVQERFFPKNKIIFQKDTLINEYDLNISITEKSLDTYVTDSFQSGDIIFLDRYRDIKYSIVIKKGKLKIIDTSFQKENFKNFTGKELIEYGNFVTYEINKINKTEIEFFGIIQEPETDWSFPFYHNYDFKKNEFKIKKIKSN